MQMIDTKKNMGWFPWACQGIFVFFVRQGFFKDDIYCYATYNAHTRKGKKQHCIIHQGIFKGWKFYHPNSTCTKWLYDPTFLPWKGT